MPEYAIKLAEFVGCLLVLKVPRPLLVSFLALTLGVSSFCVGAAFAQASLPVAAPPIDPAPATPIVTSPDATPQAQPRVARKKRPAVVRYAALPRDTRPTFTAQSVEATEAAVARYRNIVSRGGWNRVTPGNQAQIRARLQAEDDLGDGGLPAAIKRFQMRHGLRENGVVSGPTLTAMNVSAQTRLNQLEASLSRMRASSFGFGQRYVVVNIPAAAVEAIEDGQIRRRYVAVVGKADRASPPVETRITSVNFNPTWTVPTSIIKKDIIPKMQKDPGYLTRSKIRILDGRGREINPRSVDWNTERAANYTLRQDPGAGNSLGRLKIDMPNHLAVYMHDTPSKGLFAADNRFHSSGCVRVADVNDLATWLLSGNGGWDRSDTEEAISDEERKDVRLNRAVPIAWTYYTGYGMPDGTAHFRSDIYDLDSKGGGQPIAIRSTPRGPAVIEPSPATGGLEPEPLSTPSEPSFWDLFRPRSVVP